MRTVAFCEIEEYPRRVLAKHWPNVPIYRDVRDLSAARLAGDGVSADLICGGFPCQDISQAGKRVGIEGERSGLWREFARLIGEVRPRFAVVENVAAITFRGLLRVLGDLTALGYDSEWHCIPASAVGLPHERDRVWIVAYTEKIEGIYGLLDPRLCAFPYGATDWKEWASKQWLEAEPLVCRDDDGVPDRVGRTSACGNAVVPQIPEIIGRAIMSRQRQYVEH